MLNKNIIIGIVVVVLLGGGAIYYFSGSGGSIPNSPASRQGELTRELAKQMLLQEYEGIPYVYDASYDDYRSAYTIISILDNSKIKELASRGLIIERGGSVPIYFDFTEEGKKYLTEPNYKSVNDKEGKDVGVILGHFKNLEVVGIHKVDETNATVQFEIQHTLTPFGEVLEPNLTNVKSGGVFRLYDDGWRHGMRIPDGI